MSVLRTFALRLILFRLETGGCHIRDTSSRGYTRDTNQKKVPSDRQMIQYKRLIKTGIKTPLQNGLVYVCPYRRISCWIKAPRWHL
ncbi:hypothetical protein BY458DRAFT_510921 [Sporodiniella umbellata]|nr:hypothetical protein BY458DRAFT_510921 [Sporodiniella umbellata]